MLGSQCHWRSRVINFLPAFRESIKGKHFLSPSFILFIRNYFPITPFFITKRSTSMIWVPLIRTSVVTLIINICFSYGFSQKKIKKHVISIPSAWFRAMHLLFPFVQLALLLTLLPLHELELRKDLLLPLELYLALIMSYYLLLIWL